MKKVRTIIEGDYPKGNWQLTIIDQDGNTILDLCLDGTVCYGVYPKDVKDLSKIIEYNQ